MNRFVFRILRSAIVVLFCGTILAQIIAPIMLSEALSEYPEAHYVMWPYSVAAILALGCVEVSLVAIWRLLVLVVNDQVFSTAAFRWVELIIRCAVIASGLSLLVGLHAAIANIGNLISTLGMIACMTVGMGIATLMIVMRELLVTAIEYRNELDEVI